MNLHETVMGKRLIEGTLPKIARALERIADATEKQETGCYLVASHYYDNEEASDKTFYPGRIKPDTSEGTHDKWVVCESLEEAHKEYKEVLKHPLIRSAAVTKIIDGTDWWAGE